LRGFRCASGDELWDLEVQLYVSWQALPEFLARRGQREHRLLLWFDDEKLVAVGAHEAVTQISQDGTFLVVAALEVSRQGSRLPSGQRLSDAVLSDLVADGMSTHSGEVVLGCVHKDNARSIALCARNHLSVAKFRSDDDEYRFVIRHL
jgi:hypothetical protein